MQPERGGGAALCLRQTSHRSMRERCENVSFVFTRDLSTNFVEINWWIHFPVILSIIDWFIVYCGLFTEN